MNSTILATSISADQKGKQRKSVIKGLLEQFVYELCEFDFEPFNADKKVSSLDQFLSYMNEEDIFDSFSGIRNVTASDVVRAVSYLPSRNTANRDIKSVKFPL